MRRRHRVSYLGAPGWRAARMTLVYDLGDPAKPMFIRTCGLPGQQPGTAGLVPPQTSTVPSRLARKAIAAAFCKSSIGRSFLTGRKSRPTRTCFYPQKRVMFFAHFNAGVRAVDIVDRARASTSSSSPARPARWPTCRERN